MSIVGRRYALANFQHQAHRGCVMDAIRILPPPKKKKSHAMEVRFLGVILSYSFLLTGQYLKSISYLLTFMNCPQSS